MLDTNNHRELTKAELELINQLSTEDLEYIDKVILSNSSNHYRKVSMLVAKTMNSLDENIIKGIPDIFYSQRVASLVSNGKLVSQGNLKNMRYSEVKLPSTI